MGVAISVNYTATENATVLPVVHTNYEHRDPEPEENPGNGIYHIIIAVVDMLGTVCSVLGIPANIINMIVFYRQCLLSDSCTASLVCLTITDFVISLLGSLDIILTHMERSDLTKCIHQLLQIIPPIKQFFSQVTCWITVYLSLERTISVTFPFKVKQLFSPKRSYCILSVVSGITFVLRSPLMLQMLIIYDERDAAYSTRFIEWPNFIADIHSELVFANESILRTLSVLIVISLNILIAVKVVQSRRFRKRTITNEKEHNISSGSKTQNKSRLKSDGNVQKETKLVLMMLLVCVIFVICYLPHAVAGVQNIVVKAIIFGNSQYAALIAIVMYFIIYDLNFIGERLETINSSCHILIYFTLSTKYRNELLKMCSCSRKE